MVIPAPTGSHWSAYSFGDRLPKAPLQPSIGVSRHSPDSSGLPTRIAPLIALSNRARAGREQSVLESPIEGTKALPASRLHADSRDGGLRSDRTGSPRQKGPTQAPTRFRRRRADQTAWPARTRRRLSERQVQGLEALFALRAIAQQVDDVPTGCGHGGSNPNPVRRDRPLRRTSEAADCRSDPFRPTGRSTAKGSCDRTTGAVVRGTESLLTLRWRGESRANQSLKWA